MLCVSARTFNFELSESDAAEEALYLQDRNVNICTMHCSKKKQQTSF